MLTVVATNPVQIGGSRDLRPRRAALVQDVQQIADRLAARPNLGLTTAPRYELSLLQEVGLLTASLPVREGGLGLGSEPETQGHLLSTLAAVGGADLALGRLYEGHVNGLLLVQRFGSKAQVAQLSADVRGGMLSGVWNTGAKDLLRLVADEAGYKLAGVKTFATGAEFVQRPIVTAELAGAGWQMTIPSMDALHLPLDRSFWHPLGMTSSESFGVDFTGARIDAAQMIGSPGDFYRDPIFRGGAVRFAAVQAGAVIRLSRLFAKWLHDSGRGSDPYQVARMGDLALTAAEAEMWILRAANVAEECFYAEDVNSQESLRMIDCANMMRVAIERLGTAAMQKVVMGVGAHGLLQPAPFERIVRDLTMYLRQPGPDATLAAIGQRALQLHHAEGEA